METSLGFVKDERVRSAAHDGNGLASVLVGHSGDFDDA